MSQPKEVVPWKCHIRHREFDTPSGGVCSRCSRATCREHLHQIGKKLKLETKWVCNNCLTSEEKTENKWTSKISNLLLKRDALRSRRVP